MIIDCRKAVFGHKLASDNTLMRDMKLPELIAIGEANHAPIVHVRHINWPELYSWQIRRCFCFGAFSTAEDEKVIENRSWCVQLFGT